MKAAVRVLVVLGAIAAAVVVFAKRLRRNGERAWPPGSPDQADAGSFAHAESEPTAAKSQAPTEGSGAEYVIGAALAAEASGETLPASEALALEEPGWDAQAEDALELGLPPASEPRGVDATEDPLAAPTAAALDDLPLDATDALDVAEAVRGDTAEFPLPEIAPRGLDPESASPALKPDPPQSPREPELLATPLGAVNVELAAMVAEDAYLEAFAPSSGAGLPADRAAESYLDEGNVYFNVGQYALAVDRYSRAIEADRDLAAAYYNRANAHTRTSDYPRALADYDRALELAPIDADALNNRGMLHLYRGDYAAARADFDAALGLTPDDTTVIVNRGLAELHGGNAGAALADFERAVAVDGSDAAAHYGAGQAAAMLGQRAMAMESLRRAMALDPAYASEAAGDAKLESLQGDTEFMKLLRNAGARP